MELTLIAFASIIVMIISVWTIKKVMIKNSNEVLQKAIEENQKQKMILDFDFEKSIKNVAPEIVENMTNKYVDNMDQKIDERELKWQLSSNEQKKELEKMLEKMEQRDIKSELLIKQQKQELEKMQEKMEQRDKFFQENQKNNLDNSEKSFSNIAKNNEKKLSDQAKLIGESLSLLSKRIDKFEKFERDSKALMLSGQENIKDLTHTFASVLGGNNSRGTWGEMHLRKVLEMSGMLKYADFDEQKSIDNKNTMTPDVVVNLPGINKKIVVDSKTPMSNYNRAAEEDSNKKEEYMKLFVKDTKDRIKELSSKEYFKQFTNSPELVVCFFPSESILVDANRYDETLIEYAADKNVLLACPTNLIALLKTVAIAWRDEEISQNAKEVGMIGGEVYERLLVLSDHLSGLGRSINTVINAYNKTVGSYKRRVIPSAHKIKKITG